MQATRGVVRQHGLLGRQQHRTGIEAGIHLHDGNARACVPPSDGAVDGRSAPPARQQGSVDVEAPQRRNCQHLGWEDQAVGSHDHQFGRGGTQRGLLLGRAQSHWLVERKVMGQRHRLDGTGHQPASASCRPIRLSQYQTQLMTCGDQGLECDRRKRRCAGEGNAHQAVSRACLTSFLRMRSCLSRDRYSTNTLPSR